MTYESRRCARSLHGGLLHHLRLSLIAAVSVAGLALAGCTEPGPTPGAPARGVDDDEPGQGDSGDADDDGVANATDLDIDGDRVPNGEDSDADGDGTDNADDDTPYGENPDDVDGPWADLDDDGQPNHADSDDDGDGIPDGVRGEGDCEGDGTAEDEDHDCDGFCFELEGGGYVPCEDGAPPGQGAPDTDGDGVPDRGDPDDDNDGTPDGGDLTPGGFDPCLQLEAPPPPSCFPASEGEGEGEPTPGEGEGEDPPPPPPPPGPQCTTESFDPATPIPPRILLVVDRSGSMSEEAPGFADSKWIATREALVGPLFGGDGGVVGQLEDRVEMGLLTYPAENTDDVCAGGEMVRDVDLNNHSSIKSALYFTDPDGATPTAATLLEARDELASLSDDGGQRAVILATDGGPNCNRSLDGDSCRCVGTRDQCAAFSANCLDDVNTVGAAAAVQAAGFPVYVLGINGTEDFADVLTRVAGAGGTTDYFAVSSSTSLAQTIENIATDIGSCRFDLSGLPVASELTVRIDGAVVGHDNARQNGFDVVGLSTLELFGSACDAARSTNGQVTVERCDD
ncbi:MAG: VWA domain-containing protein [Deltaproteobacteria bacterium]|nr:VWA domain-containing protein [Deltaproteobacteria bacterium]